MLDFVRAKIDHRARAVHRLDMETSGLLVCFQMIILFRLNAKYLAVSSNAIPKHTNYNLALTHVPSTTTHLYPLRAHDSSWPLEKTRIAFSATNFKTEQRIHLVYTKSIWQSVKVTLLLVMVPSHFLLVQTTHAADRFSAWIQHGANRA